ncbi:S9 family peptidase [Acidothermaceae bacterium B102]|nr:S9 family peptidase [Acidothermaceae bacterium B102]
MLPSDLALVRVPGAPTLSPDGRWAVVAVSRPDLEADAYRSQLWRVDLSGSTEPRQLTFGERDSEPAWSPDGRSIAFLRGTGDAPAQLVVMAADGGEARPLPAHPLGAARPVWSPDSTHIAYAARVPEAGRYEQGKDARAPGHEAPRRITSMRFRLDNVGFLRDRPKHVFVLNASAVEAEPLQVTTDDLGWDTPTWSPDGASLLLAPAHHDRDNSLANDVYRVSVTGGAAERLTSGQLIATSVVAHEGIVYAEGLDELDEAGRTPGLFRLSDDPGEAPVRLTDAEACELTETAGGHSLLATPDGLLTVSAKGGSVQLVRVPYDGGVPEVLSPPGRQVRSFAVAGEVVVATLADAVSMGEIFVLEDGQWLQRSNFGAALAEGTTLLPMHELATQAPDGYPVHGWLVRPAGAGPHPVLLLIHGGPFTQYGYTLLDEAQVYASAGYAVVMGNPRGSSGYGEAHGRAIVGDMGNLDRADLMALLEVALTEPGLDANRVGVMGGSYGGYMSAWLAAHEDRFQAAIVERALLAWDSFEGSSDIGWVFGDIYIGADPAKLRDQSPLTHVDAVDIPVLIIHSEQDWRCPVEQAQRYFVALRRRGKPAELLLFPGEGHELSRSGLPSHRLARFDAVLDWWARHLG